MSNLKNNLIAKKYSEALAELSLDQKTLEDIELVSEVFNTNQELREILNSPSIDLASKKNILSKSFSGAVQDLVVKLLLILLEKRRVNLVGLLEQNYKAIYFEQKNIGLAQIQSATQFTDDELSEIRQQLEKSFKQDIQISSSVKPDLIAGMKINIAGKVIDSSLKTKLKKIKTLLGA
jgi:F-type H+-transporting ATPase subunit delta